MEILVELSGISGCQTKIGTVKTILLIAWDEFAIKKPPHKITPQRYGVDAATRVAAEGARRTLGFD
jgi:hypothetical protein